LAALAARGDGRQDAAFFEFYGSELNEACLLGTGQTVSGLFSALVRQRNEPGLNWLLALMTSAPDLLRKFRGQQNEEAAEAFERRVRDCLVAPSTDGAQHLIEQIAAVCGIVRPEPDLMSQEGAGNE
jgi:hypothetical protein